MDRELVERARHGDRAAYEALVRGVARRLFLICQRILRDSDQAEDATQRALVAMWRDLPGLRDPDRFEAWTYRLAVRASLAEARRERRMRASVRLLPSDPAEGPDELASVVDRGALEAAFERLTPEHRAVVVLRFFAGLPNVDIARIVGVPVGTVDSRLHYALLRLRGTLEAGEDTIALQRGVPA